MVPATPATPAATPCYALPVAAKPCTGLRFRHCYACYAQNAENPEWQAAGTGEGTGGGMLLSIYIPFFMKMGVAGVAAAENALPDCVLPRYAQVENGRSRRSSGRSRPQKKSPASGRA